MTSYIISNAQTIDKLLEPKCDGKKIEYSIYGNLREYLDNENNIDGRELYKSVDQFKGKKIGIISGVYLGELTFENSQDLVYLLMFKRVDVGITIDEQANDLQMLTNEVSLFPEPLLSIKVGFGLQKENADLLAKLNEFIKSNPALFT